jgi:tetratricopeptide (TPR) repeat protein
MATLAMKASPHVSWRRTWLGGVIAVGGFVLLIAGYMLLRALGVGPFASLLSAGTLQKNEKLLVADFSTSASDTSMGPLVTDAFRTALGQSQSITVVQPTDVRDVLRRMQKPGNTKVDFAVAREIATREGIKAVVVGDVIALGGNYAISVRLVSPQSGDELATLRETADGEKALLPAIDKLAKDLRAKIGESLRMVRAAQPLERVTTPSLAALKKYVQGNRVMSFEGDFAKGAALLEESIALDSGFAMAYRRLAVEYNNRFQFDKSMALMQKAYDHRERASDAERYLLIAGYFEMGPKQDIAKSIAAYESLIDLQPDFTTALNNAAVNYMAQRNYAKAEEYFIRAIRTGSAPAVSYTNLVGALWAQGKRTDAWRWLAVSDSVNPSNPGGPGLRSALLSSEGKYDSASAIRRALIQQRPNDLPTHAGSANALAAVARTKGQLREAARWNSEAAAVNAQRGLPQASLQQAIGDATARFWFLGDHATTVAALDRALAETPLEKIPVATRPYAGLTFAYALAGRSDKAKQLLASYDRAKRTVVQSGDEVTRHTILGSIALAEKRYKDAVDEFQAADKGGCLTCALPLIAYSLDLAGRSDSALVAYERYLSTNFAQRFNTDAQFLAGTHKRLGELYEAKGDKQNAMSHYLKFIDLWKDADPELLPKVAEVRGRIARLKDQERK